MTDVAMMEEVRSVRVQTSDFVTSGIIMKNSHRSSLKHRIWQEKWWALQWRLFITVRLCEQVCVRSDGVFQKSPPRVNDTRCSQSCVRQFFRR